MRDIGVTGVQTCALPILAREIERQGKPESDSEAQQQFDAALKAAPDNVALRLEVMRLAAKRGDADAVRRANREGVQEGRGVGSRGARLVKKRMNADSDSG